MGLTPSKNDKENYKTPEERKIEAEKKAKEDAKKNHGKQIIGACNGPT